MTYYRGARRPSSPLTPPVELVGKFVTWPRKADGKRVGANYGTCDAYNADTQTLTLRVAQEATPWNGGTGERVVQIPLSSGPFRVVS